ncbi:flagellar biosynthesis protein FlhA [Acidithiobacillus sp. AMEEHan]|uniref:flagellar biosynthesis protein FlhA n=1 Tax=Acidithiobacillus sp. AMEEHan TaxID=2994951 RepID=UPI0027E45EBB|nr:flagellar biosynthesis protein FlhA [Acidithiobacillus sp. AMEEHan]
MDGVLRLLRRINWHTLAAPILVIMILAMLIIPLPTFLLDIFFTFNISLGLIILLVSLYMTRPLEFSAFPTALLLTTLLRLSLNVAAARIILLHGQNGTGAAGVVIESFGEFVVGGDYAVGIIVFAILVIINFVVITKGAGRIAEVSARFTLDAMPGKQMAIDADLNAGLIDQQEAQRRRQEIAQEADFFGAMDGASKFVRGDAIAAILILFINLIGGLTIGVWQHGLSLSTAAHDYTLLSIGDALVAQIPALVISIAAGIVVSTVNTGTDLGRQLMGELLRNDEALIVVAIIFALLGLIPGMPHIPFLGAALVLGGYAWWRRRQRPKEVESPPPLASEPEEVNWDSVEPVDPLGLELGYRLIPLVDKGSGGELLARIRGVRKKYAQDFGFLVPAVHVRDNLELRPTLYRITIRGVEVASGEVLPDLLLAIDPGNVLGTLEGTPTRDPSFGLPAVWIDARSRDKAVALGYTVVDPATVIATHLHQVLQQRAAELLGREEVEGLLSHLAVRSPKLVEDVIPKLLSVDRFKKILQNLLRESVPIRDLRTIVETLAEHAAESQDIDALTAAVRQALGPYIVQNLFAGQNELPVAVLDATLEQLLQDSLRNSSDHGQGDQIEPGLAQKVLEKAGVLMQQMEANGMQPVLLAMGPLRGFLARFLARSAPRLRVLSYGEIPDNKRIRVIGTLGA